MRADRLLTILLHLQDGKKWTAKDLAERLEVSERTVMRDMEALSASGVPVYADRGYNGGWQLAEGYRTVLSGMNEEDVRLLLLAQMSRFFEDLGMRRQTDKLLAKLSAGLTASSRRDASAVQEKIHVDGAGWTESMEKFPHLPVLYDAVWNEKTVIIRYGRENDTVERELHPLGLVAKGSIWYVVGVVDGDVRTYRVSRVLDVKEGSDTAFERPPNFSLAEFWERSTSEFRTNLPKYIATVRVKSSAIGQLKNVRFVTILSTGADQEGWTTVEVDFQMPDYACRSALSLGPDLVVLEPKELREAVVGAASELLRLYGVS